MNRRGFTLLEVLIATLIMAVAVAGLLANLSTSLANAARLTESDRATRLARRTMDELLVAPPPRFTVVQGRWDQPGFEGGWSARRTPFDSPPGTGAGARVLDRIEVEVWWMHGERRRTFALEGYKSLVLTPDEVSR